MSLRKPVRASRIRPVLLWLSILGSVLLQATLPAVFPLARLFEFPLLVTIYFSVASRDKIFGIFLGTGLGLLQDALSHSYLGLMGMAEGLAGYLAVSASTKFDVDHAFARSLLVATLVIVQNLLVAFLRHVLLEASYPMEPLRLASSALVNIALGLVLFRLFDRFQRSA
jgi:rod shape-determining protein MreD